MSSLLISFALLIGVVTPLLAWVFRKDRRLRAELDHNEEVT
jgi:hypothetical protein